MSYEAGQGTPPEMNATLPVVRWLVRPYESDEWRITSEPPTDELRRWFEFKKFTPA